MHTLALTSIEIANHRRIFGKGQNLKTAPSKSLEGVDDIELLATLSRLAEVFLQHAEQKGWESVAVPLESLISGVRRQRMRLVEASPKQTRAA